MQGSFLENLEDPVTCVAMVWTESWTGRPIYCSSLEVLRFHHCLWFHRFLLRLKGLKRFLSKVSRTQM